MPDEPATRYVIVATRAADRWFDLDAVRTAHLHPKATHTVGNVSPTRGDFGAPEKRIENNPAGAPPLDWYLDDGTPPRWDTDMTVGTAKFLIGDVFQRLAELPDGSIDLVCSSPPFLALRSYLPADHPDKNKEIGSEATPADFLDTLLHLTAEFGRVLAPHGSLAIELGDTYSGSGGAGGDYNEGGMREGQGPFDGSARQARRLHPDEDGRHRNSDPDRKERRYNRNENGGPGWPLAKSLTGTPTLYAWSLAYGRNLLTGQPSPAGRWRIRNVIPWTRPNPPVGMLGDKFRPATSYVTVATRAADRWFDLDAVRTAYKFPNQIRAALGNFKDADNKDSNRGALGEFNARNSAGAPPLDWYLDDQWTDQPEPWGVDDGMWKINTEGFAGSHYATWPRELVRRLVLSMCPREVCRECGKARRRIVDAQRVAPADDRQRRVKASEFRLNSHDLPPHIGWEFNRTTLGWSDCGHNNYRPGVVLDPFVGSGTTLVTAVRCGRDAIGIDLDESNVELAKQRMKTLPLEVDGATPAPVWAADSLFGVEPTSTEDVEPGGAL